MPRAVPFAPAGRVHTGRRMDFLNHLVDLVLHLSPEKLAAFTDY